MKTYIHTNLHTSVHGSFINNSQKLATIQVSFNGWTVKQIWMKLQKIMLRKKRDNPKRLHTVQLHFYNILEITKLQKWRTDRWVPGACGRGVGEDDVAIKGQQEGPLCWGTALRPDSTDVYILTVVCVPVPHVTIGGEWEKDPYDFSVLFLNNCMWIYNNLQIKTSI